MRLWVRDSRNLFCRTVRLLIIIFHLFPGSSPVPGLRGTARGRADAREQLQGRQPLHRPTLQQRHQAERTGGGLLRAGGAVGRGRRGRQGAHAGALRGVAEAAPAVDGAGAHLAADPLHQESPDRRNSFNWHSDFYHQFKVVPIFLRQEFVFTGFGAWVATTAATSRTLPGTATPGGTSATCSGT